MLKGGSLENATTPLTTTGWDRPPAFIDLGGSHADNFAWSLRCDKDQLQGPLDFIRNDAGINICPECLDFCFVQGPLAAVVGSQRLDAGAGGVLQDVPLDGKIEHLADDLQGLVRHSRGTALNDALKKQYNVALADILGLAVAPDLHNLFVQQAFIVLPGMLIDFGMLLYVP